jgi:predicted nucleic acid-binding protein
MRPETVVSDTGPILHLHEANALDLLSLLGSVWVPSAVDREVNRLVGDWPAHRPRQLKIAGSLGVVLWAAADAHLDRQQSAVRLEALFSSSLWVSSSVREQAREALKQIHTSS